MEQETLKIALITGGVPLGGSTTFLLNLGSELVRRGIPLLVVSLERDNPYADDFRLRRIPLHVEDDRSQIFEDRLASALDRVREFDPKVVVACLGPSSFEMLRYLPEGIRRLGMIQSDFPENYPPFVPYLPVLDGMIGVSQEIAAKLRAHHRFGTIPTYYLPYGIDVPAQIETCGMNTDAPLRVLYLGRLSRPQKRVHIFPRILQQLCDARIPFEWTIAGDGPEAAWLHENLRTEHDARVRFLGSVQYRDVPGILRNHDVFLLASDAEGLPLSLLEAMAHGLVPVISNLPSGVAEVASSECAMLVEPKNVAGYGEAIIWLAQNRGKLIEMSARARERVRKEYSVEAMADRWLDILTGPVGVHVDSWPKRFQIRGPLGNANKLQFNPVARFLRRRWRSWGAPPQSTPT